VRILRSMRLLALGDRNPDFLTHREIDSTLQLLPADVDCRGAGPEALELAEYRFFLATAFQPQVGSSQSGELHPILFAWLWAAALH
jgi:hypothetical protein